MLKLVGWMIRSTVFAVFVLVTANLVRWNGRTVNDQIRVRLSHAERAGWMEGLGGWSGKVADGMNLDPEGMDRRRGASRRRRRPASRLQPAESGDPRDRNLHAGTIARNEREGAPPEEKVSPSERQKLRALIQELNNGKDARN